MAAASASPSARATPTVSVPQSSATPQPPAPSFLDILPSLSSLISRLETAPVPSANPDPNPELPPLSAKDLPTMTDDVKIQLQKARKQIHQLPDIDVSVAEQEAEMKELDAKIKAQREILERLKGGGQP